MLQISKRVDYAVQLLKKINTLEQDEFLSLKKFSREKEISFLFLQRIARILKEAQIIDSKRGVCGGYFLNKKIKNLSLKKIIEIVDGSIGITTCSRINFKKNNHEKCSCGRENKCESKKIFIELNQEINNILDKIIII
jgi:Rrf2 family protein